ncbi:DUF4249 domain-containing protein [Aquimarina agarilytica]|uniref:DUF4249 family protein n=1 Tax=Aquimarina agarilytica TaxID=1087449 RepID=UPI000287AA20|nr:DUF4249 family protein [Aquimarina agarilytica]
MKKIFLLILIAISSFGCEDVIDIDLPSAPPRLVINASLERNFQSDGSFKDIAIVRLSLSTPFFSTEKKYVEDAIVTITNLNTNQVFTIENTPFNTGTYQNQSKDLLVIEPDTNYKLTVIHNNTTYESIEQLNVSTPIDEATQIKNTNNFDEDEFAIEIKYTDIPNMTNFYVFDFGWGNLQSINHEDFFEDGKQTPTTQFFEETRGDVFRIRLLGSDKRFNNYINALVQLSGETSNGPFSTVPFKAKGNIINTNNPEDFPFGYFHVNEVYAIDVNLVPNSEL